MANDPVFSHIIRSRLSLCRYDHGAADRLIKAYGNEMAQIMGEHDFQHSSCGADFSKLTQTFNNAKR